MKDNEKKGVSILTERIILGQVFRIYGTVEKPLFLVADIARAINHSTPSKLANIVDEQNKLLLPMNSVHTQDSHGGLRANTEYLFVTEQGLYRILMRSDKPNAQPFQDKVCEILTEIRQTGGYIHTEPDDDDDMIMARALVVAQRKIELRDKQLAAMKEENKKQQEQLALQAHKVDFYDAVTKSDDLLTMKEATDILAIKGYGRNKTLALLRFKGIFNDENVPYRQYTDKGYFAVKEHDYTTKYGNTRHSNTTYVTHKGLEFLRKVILKDMENKNESKGE